MLSFLVFFFAFFLFIKNSLELALSGFQLVKVQWNQHRASDFKEWTWGHAHTHTTPWRHQTNVSTMNTHQQQQRLVQHREKSCFSHTNSSLHFERRFLRSRELGHTSKTTPPCHPHPLSSSSSSFNISLKAANVEFYQFMVQHNGRIHWTKKKKKKQMFELVCMSVLYKLQVLRKMLQCIVWSHAIMPLVSCTMNTMLLLSLSKSWSRLCVELGGSVHHFHPVPRRFTLLFVYTCIMQEWLYSTMSFGCFVGFVFGYGLYSHDQHDCAIHTTYLFCPLYSKCVWMNVVSEKKKREIERVRKRGRETTMRSCRMAQLEWYIKLYRERNWTNMNRTDIVVHACWHWLVDDGDWVRVPANQN